MTHEWQNRDNLKKLYGNIEARFLLNKHIFLYNDEKTASRDKSASIFQSGSDECRRNEGKYCRGKKIRRVCVLLRGRQDSL